LQALLDAELARDVAHSIMFHLCVLVMLVKMTEMIEMMFERQIHMDPRNHF